MKRATKKILVLGIVAGAIFLVRLSGLHEYLTVERLQQSRAALKQFVGDRYALSAAGYVLSYIIVTAVSLPGATVLTLAGGFLFGMEAALFVNVGATAGSALAFLVARYLVGEWVQAKYGARLAKFNQEISRHGRYYLLTLRLIPLFPFFLINNFSGLTRIPLWTFVWTTSVGIIPGTLVYVFAGTRLGTIHSPAEILSTNMILALVLLGLMAISPVVIKFLKKYP